MGELKVDPTSEDVATDLQGLPVEYDDVSEARVRRKLDWHMMPLFFVLCKQTRLIPRAHLDIRAGTNPSGPFRYARFLRSE